MGRKEKHTLEFFESGNPKIGDNWVLLFPPKGTCCPLSNVWCLIIPYIVRLFHSWLLLKRHQFFTAFFLSFFFLPHACIYSLIIVDWKTCPICSQRGAHILGQKLSVLGDVGLRYCTVGSSALRNGGSATQSRNQLLLLSCWFQGLLKGLPRLHFL